MHQLLEGSFLLFKLKDYLRKDEIQPNEVQRRTEKCLGKQVRVWLALTSELGAERGYDCSLLMYQWSKMPTRQEHSSC